MGVLHIQHIQPGMKLAEDIVGFNGVTLLRKGCVLTERHLNAFDMWGITEADISGVETVDLDAIDQDDIDPEIVRQMEGGLDRLFQKTDREDPVTAELYRIIKKIKLKALMHENAS